MKTFLIIYLSGVFIMCALFLLDIIEEWKEDNRELRISGLIILFLSWLGFICTIIAFWSITKEDPILKEDFRKGFGYKLYNLHKYIPLWTRYHIQSRYLLTPYATVIINLNTTNPKIFAFKMVYIFGIRVARIHLIL